MSLSDQAMEHQMAKMVTIAPSWWQTPAKIVEHGLPRHEQKVYRIWGEHEQAVLFSQAGDAGAAAGRMWKSCPTNAMRLPSVLNSVDKDQSGTIDRDEFRELVKRHGGFVGSERMFSQLDKDNSGTLDRSEVAKMFAFNQTRSLTSGR